MVKDLDRLTLVRAIAYQETSNCTKGVALTHNNCFGTMTWKTGNREFRRFENNQAGYDYTYGLIERMYDGLSLKEMAVKYSGNDRADHWHKNVLHWYNKLI